MNSRFLNDHVLYRFLYSVEALWPMADGGAWGRCLTLRAPFGASGTRYVSTRGLIGPLHMYQSVSRHCRASTALQPLQLYSSTASTLYSPLRGDVFCHCRFHPVPLGALLRAF
eukprot:2437126-Prymnesium_polylepis.1